MACELVLEAAGTVTIEGAGTITAATTWGKGAVASVVGAGETRLTFDRASDTTERVVTIVPRSSANYGALTYANTSDTEIRVHAWTANGAAHTAALICFTYSVYRKQGT